MLEQISHILTLTLSSNVCCIFAHSIDLVPRQNALNWLRYLRHSTPTLPFRSSTSHQRSNLSSSTAPALMRILKAYKPSAAQSVTVGVVGYPNVGKSSTINALLGEKKVSVSSTPGKTKHFQTIHLSPSLVLCDCPGLVFPQFATTKADLVCDGVLPIDQLREHTGPIGLVVKRIPKQILEAIYGLSVRTRGVEEGGDGKITGTDLLVAYASTCAYC